MYLVWKTPEVKRSGETGLGEGDIEGGAPRREKRGKGM
jgi:hypothetical protein